MLSTIHLGEFRFHIISASQLDGCCFVWNERCREWEESDILSTITFISLSRSSMSSLIRNLSLIAISKPSHWNKRQRRILSVQAGIISRGVGTYKFNRKIMIIISLRLHCPALFLTYLLHAPLISTRGHGTFWLDNNHCRRWVRGLVCGIKWNNWQCMPPHILVSVLNYHN